MQPDEVYILSMLKSHVLELVDEIHPCPKTISKIQTLDIWIISYLKYKGKNSSVQSRNWLMMKFIIFSTTVQSIVKGMKQSIHTLSDMNFMHFWVYSGKAFGSCLQASWMMHVYSKDTEIC